MLSRKFLRWSAAFVALIGVWSGVIAFTERTRTISGTWVDLFEGSRFFEKMNLSDACTPSFWKASWFAYYPPSDSPIGKMLMKNRNSGQFLSEYGPYPVAAYKVKFVGHRNVSEFYGLSWILGVGYGHMGSWGSEMEVDKMLSIQPIANVYCDIRQP